jgi:hypothetical protein
MLEYKGMKACCNSSKSKTIHKTLVWQYWMFMIEIMHDIVKATITKVVKIANYISIFCDEVTSVDNQSRWLSLHTYVIKDWSWIQILVSLEKVTKRIDSGDIIRIITQAMLIASLIGESLSFKFIFLELTMWVFFKVPRLELCDKFNWIMFFTCKAYIAWLIKLIWSYKLCLSWT